MLHAIHPALGFNADVQALWERQTQSNAEADWEIGEVAREKIALLLWLMQFEIEDAAEICERLRLEKPLREAVLQASEWRAKLSELVTMRPSQATKALDGLSPLARYALFLQAGERGSAEVLARHNREWQHVRPHTDGQRLKELGLAEGPRYAEILDKLRDAWLDGDVNSAEAEEAMLMELLDG